MAKKKINKKSIKKQSAKNTSIKKKVQLKSSALSVKSKNIPATQGMLYELRNELGSRIIATEYSLEGKINAVENRLDARISTVESRLDAKISAVENRLSAKISTLESRLTAVENRLDARICAVEHRLDSLDKKIDSVKSEILSKMNSGFEKLSAQIHRIALIVEEQNARNKFALDGYVIVHEKQNILEKRVNEIEDNIKNISKS